MSDKDLVLSLQSVEDVMVDKDLERVPTVTTVTVTTTATSFWSTVSNHC